MSIFAPKGVPISSVSGFEDVAGELDWYEYEMFGGAGSFAVHPNAGGALDDHEPVKRVNSEYDPIQVTKFDHIGHTYLFRHQQHKKFPYLDTFQLSWIEDGALMQLFATTFGARGVYPSVGPDALLDTARLVRKFELDDLDSPDLVTGGLDIFESVHIVQVAAAAILLGFKPVTPEGTSHLTVIRAGEVRGYAADVDAKGLRRLYRVPGMPTSEEGPPNLTQSEEVTVGGQHGVYQTLETESGITSLLFFSVGSESFVIRDTEGATSLELISAAESTGALESSSGVTLKVDANPTNDGGPCVSIDESHTIASSAFTSVALCLLEAELPPVNGGLTSLHLTLDYTAPLTGTVIASDLGTDVNGNPNWNEVVSPGASWDCNVLNSQGTAPRATSPAEIVCDSTTLSDQPFSGASHLATLTFDPAASAGTTTVIWNAETELLAGIESVQCDGVTLQCEGATITVDP